MIGTIACQGLDGKTCKYFTPWLCKHPKCKTPVLTSTMIGVRPKGCPKAYKYRWDAIGGK